MDRPQTTELGCLPTANWQSLATGATVVVAVSGGADSVALWDLAAAAGFALTVWHLDHGLRAESAVDAAWVAQRARRHDHACIIESTDIAVLARCRGCGLEEAGRDHRYARLQAVAGAIGAGAVLTAHHADDRAESILMHVLRGAGPGGWQGIAAQRNLTPGIALIRPLLGVSRAQLRAWLTTREQTWREDLSNRDLRFTRNRIRHMISEWEAVAPGFTASLLTMADQQSADYRRVSTLASACLDVANGADGIRVAPLLAAEEPVRTATLALHLMGLGIAADRGRLRRLGDLISGPPGRRLVIGTMTWLRRADRLVWQQLNKSQE